MTHPLHLQCQQTVDKTTPINYQQVTTTLEQPSASKSDGDDDDDDDDMLDDLENVDKLAILTTPNEANLLHQCQVEMEAYLADKGLPFRKEHNKRECYAMIFLIGGKRRKQVSNSYSTGKYILVHFCQFGSTRTEAGHPKWCH